VSAQDIDVTFRVKTDKADPTGFLFAYFAARRVKAGTMYLGRLDIAPTGGVLLQAAKSVSKNVTFLGSEQGVPGLNHVPGSYIWVHGQVTGINPTTIRMRAWADGQPEPATWHYTVTDSEPKLQKAGQVGLRTFVTTGASNLPIVFSFDDYLVTGAAASNPTATPTLIPPNTPTPEPPPTETPVPATAVPTATPAGPVSAADSYARNINDSWGNADVGGAYSYIGNTADFDVNGSAGTMRLGAPNVLRSANLMGVSIQDLEASFRFQTDKVAQGGGQMVYLLARRAANGNDYFLRVRMPPDGTLRIQAGKEVNGAATLFGAEGLVTGVSQAANSFFRVRFQVTGANPTTLRMRVWPDGSAEPGFWQYSANDSDAALQGAGAVGFRGYVASTSTNTPLLLSFDDLVVTGPTDQSLAVEFQKAKNKDEPRAERFPERMKKYPKH
jgi:hypothetical protein